MEQRVIGYRSYGRLVDKVKFKEDLLATLLIYHYAPSSLLANVMGSKQSEIESVLVDLVVDYCKSVGKVDFKQVWEELKISYKYILLAIEEGRIEVKSNNIELFAEVFRDREKESQIENQKKRKEALARQLQNAFNSDIEELNKQREVVCKGYHFIRK